MQSKAEKSQPCNLDEVVGVISDTHGLLRPEAVAALQGSDFIIHAGDVGDPAILEKLRQIAPVTAVRGNVDRGPWTADIPATNVLEVRPEFLFTSCTTFKALT